MATVKKIFVVLMLLLCLPMVSKADDRVVHYPPSAGDFDPRQQYPVELLKLALQHSGKAYQLKPTSQYMLQGRALRNLQQNKLVDIVWSMTDKERERELRPIRIPIWRGLLGYRLLLIREQDQQRFRQLASLDELKALNAIQGHDWTDSEILKANQFTITTGANYLSLFKMLQKKRADYFPRSVVEIWQELEAHQDKQLAIENSWLVRYPTAGYFFVNSDNHQLAQDVKRGLEAILSNGHFEQLFNQYFGAIIHQAKLDQRRLISLSNPLLPMKTPLARQELWYQLPSE